MPKLIRLNFEKNMAWLVMMEEYVSLEVLNKTNILMI